MSIESFEFSRAIEKEVRELDPEFVEAAKILFTDNDWKTRQTTVYTLGEIGKIDAKKVTRLLGKALGDDHHSVRNAVKGSLKQMGEKNPIPTLAFAKKFLHSPSPETRRQIIHGIELRGRTHPEDILPLLKELEFDQSRMVRKTLIHILGQISYKEGCLEKVVKGLKKWKNKELVREALDYILEIHKRYKNFSSKTYKEAKKYIETVKIQFLCN